MPPAGPPMGSFPPPSGVYVPYGSNGGSENPWRPNTLNEDEVGRWFREVDKDGNGRISVTELNQALSASGSVFSLATTERLLRRFDKDQSGEISFPEFKDLHLFILAMKEGFELRDKGRDGRLSGPEVREALAARGYGISEDTFQALMRKFDRQKRGSLAFDDYVELSIFMTSVRDTFSFYDKDSSGKVVFNFNTFLMGAVSVISL